MAESAADRVLLTELTPMELSIVKIMRAHSVTVEGDTPRCRQCSWKWPPGSLGEAPSQLNAERAHQARVILRAIAGE